MNCENALQNIVLAQYGELPDELQHPLEQHLSTCESCRSEWNIMLALSEELALDPVVEPSPNLLAASRMRLDEALDAMPPRSVMQKFWANTFRWLGYVQGAPALTVLLVGIGFLGGDFIARYEAAHAPRLPQPVIFTGQGSISSVAGIEQTPNPDIVKVKYNRVVPETVQGSLDDPQIRQLLMLGTKLATNSDAHADSVALLAKECVAGHGCDGSSDNSSGDNVRNALVSSVRYDKSPTVRLKALEGLQPYVAADEQVRNAVLDALMSDSDPDVRSEAISLLEPVQADSSVRQVLRTVSSQDANPAIRNASFQALQGTADIE